MRSGKSEEQITREVQRLLEERGRKPLEMARKAVLEEKIECKQVKEALRYFMTEYWQDLARPTLLSICCEAVGGDPKDTTPFAVPLSLISGAIDIHDDIIDKSKTKNGKPTVYGKYGNKIALLVADALLFKGFTLLYEAGKHISQEKMDKIMDTIKDMFFELGDAEALELQFRGRIDVTPEEYLYVLRKKAADVEAHTRIAALLGDANEQEIKTLSKYGRLLGMLIILRDDILDLLDVDELKNRITNEHLPLPTLYAAKNIKIKSKLEKIFGSGRATNKDIKLVQKITEKGGGIRASKELVEELAKKALAHTRQIRVHRIYLRILINALTHFNLRK